MRDFAKSVLNYFAAFSETRFRFNKRLSYEWADDVSTLDLSVFPAFEQELLNAVAAGAPFSLSVSPGRHCVILDPEKVRAHMLGIVRDKLDAAALEAHVVEVRQRLEEALLEDERDGIEKRAVNEGLRQYNLALRQAVQDGLVKLQNDRIEELRGEFGFKQVPPSTFNSQREVQRLYDDLNGKIRNRAETDGYVDEVYQYLNEQSFNYVIYDLYLGLRQFLQFVGTQTIHVFFHEMVSDGGPRYPLFTVEVMGTDGDEAISIKTVRDVIMLNTPAVNSFEFDTVLTTPRACRFTESASQLSDVERFIQAKFKVPESFVLCPHYQPLVGDKLPDIRYRIGLQAVKDEDRRILDYSELITTLDEGGGRKFTDMVSRYVGSNVVNTVNEVDRQYSERYPHGSSERLVPKHLNVPLQLNEIQRKILTAVENPKNEIIVVDGPPGTGKSYTITALVYLASQLGKSVLVTSHKRQALDVIDQTLTEQFKRLHPQAKPSVLRLEKARGPGGINSLQNTLSVQAINAAHRRVGSLRRDTVESDRERIREQVSDQYAEFWQQADICKDRQVLTLAWLTELSQLLGDGADSSDLTPQRFPAKEIPAAESLHRLFNSVTSDVPSLSLESLAALFDVRNEIPNVLKQCDALNGLSAAIPDAYVAKVSAVPREIATFSEIAQRLAACMEAEAKPSSLQVEALAIDAPSDILGELRCGYSETEAALGMVTELAKLQSKLLGALRHRKQQAAVHNQLTSEHAHIAGLVAEQGAASVRDALTTRLDGVKALKQGFPFLNDDYLISGYSQYAPQALKTDAKALCSLAFAPVVKVIENIAENPFDNITFAEMAAMCKHLISLKEFLALRASVETFAGHVGISVDDLPRLYATLKAVAAALNVIAKEDVAALTTVFDTCGDMLVALGIERTDLSTLFTFARDSERRKHLEKFIELHGQLSALPNPIPPEQAKVEAFFAKTQRLLQRDADNRFSNMLNSMGDVARLQTVIDSGKRISLEQARVLLSNLTCIISEPSLVSQHFPMEPDMIDILIIDEASQVSIAESISLMLRAKQTIVFGDELQYGAVGAVNVSQQYSEYYFRDILTDFAKTQNATLSNEERDRLAQEASANPGEEDEESSTFIPVSPGTREWLKTFSVRTSTLAFAKALQNYSASLNTHFRSFPEIISYSNDVFYRPSQIELITNRIRTKPIAEVLRFLPVTTNGLAGRNINLDEIEAIQHDIERVVGDGYKGTIGVICSFKEQTARMEEMFRQNMTSHPDLVRNHKFSIWFVGDVQGEERDLVYYSFVQDKKQDNADLRTIYPTVGGTADDIRKLKMQRLNVGFSRAKDVMVFVHSMDIGDYSDSRLGDALRHYEQIRQEFRRNIPKYRVDFLLTKTDGGKEKSLIIEYDGLEFHTKNPEVVTAQNFDQEYLEYDIERQVELESYGYAFLRINKFSLAPTAAYSTPVAVLDSLLRARMKDV